VSGTGGAPGPEHPRRRELWAAAFQDRAERLTERAAAERRRHRSVDAVFDMVDRDADVGGGIIAGALAYRLFIWLLPLALVLVAGLGFAADAAENSPQEVAETVGLDDLVTGSVAGAANSSNRWYALLIGIPILLWVTRSVLRVLIGAHRLVWMDVRAAAPKATPVATLRFFGLLLLFPVASLAAGAVREWSPGVGVLATLLATLPYAAIWIVVMLQLPHRDADVRALVPGALLFGLGVEIFHLFAAYVFVPYVAAKQGTYGALGAAAALLFGLFLLSRLIVAAAIVDATLWERRARTAEPAPG
jgi:uncharacterized BrkB/YihY/UPF0761 family membrane protein